MSQPHKHKDLIIAWANGAQIQYWHKTYNDWQDTLEPHWASHMEYRVKPKDKVKKYLFVYHEKGEPIRFNISTYYYKDETDFTKHNSILTVVQRIDASMIEVEEE